MLLINNFSNFGNLLTVFLKLLQLYQQQQASFQQMTAFNQQPQQAMFANQNLSQQFGALSLGNQTTNTGNLWQ